MGKYLPVWSTMLLLSTSVSNQRTQRTPDSTCSTKSCVTWFLLHYIYCRKKLVKGRTERREQGKSTNAHKHTRRNTNTVTFLCLLKTVVIVKGKKETDTHTHCDASLAICVKPPRPPPLVRSCVCVCVCGHSACWQLVCLSILSAGAELRLSAKTLPQLLSPLLSFPFCLQLLFVSVLKRYTRSLLFITLRHRCNSLIGRHYIKRLASLNDRSQKSVCLSICSLLLFVRSKRFSLVF